MQILRKEHVLNRMKYTYGKTSPFQTTLWCKRRQIISMDNCCLPMVKVDSRCIIQFLCTKIQEYVSRFQKFKLDLKVEDTEHRDVIRDNTYFGAVHIEHCACIQTIVLHQRVMIRHTFSSIDTSMLVSQRFFYLRIFSKHRFK